MDKRNGICCYYGGALTNGVLSIQQGTDPGVMLYMLPLGPGDSKAKSIHGWGTKFESFWCCYDSGVESFSKLGDSIYFEEKGKVPGLYIIQYISSVLSWKSGHMTLDQKVDPVVSSDPFLRLTLTISFRGVRPIIYPESKDTVLDEIKWCQGNIKQSELAFSIPSDQWNNNSNTGTFLSVTKQWINGDKLTLQLPISLRAEAIQDDRPQYASIQAILYGPYLLAGHSNGDWNIKTERDRSLADWVTPIPASYNDHLVTFSQVSGKSSFVLTNSNKSITREKLPLSGTDGAVHATFRLIFNDLSSSNFSSVKDVIGKSVMLETFDHPGMLVVHKGTNDRIKITNSPSHKRFSYFRLVSRLDGRHGSISLESVHKRGCFIYGGEYLTSDASLKLSSIRESSDTKFNRRASFEMRKGISKYDPISFVAKGVNRNFVLSPLLSFRDEHYTAYFKIEK